MTQAIKLPNGDTLQFPDDMPDDAIAKAISDNYPEFAPKKAATPRVLAGLPVKDPGNPDPAPAPAADQPKVLAGLPVQQPAAPDAPLLDDATNTDPKQNQFAAGRMSRADYEKEFRTLNPRAPQSAVDAVLAQYDQQKADQLKAADAQRQAGPIKPVPTAEQFFNERLNRRLNQHNAEVNDPYDTHDGTGIVPQLPGYTPPDLSNTDTTQPPTNAPAGGIDRVLDNALTSIFSQVSGAAASVGDRLGLDVADDHAQHEKWEQYRKAAGYDTGVGDRVVGMTAAMVPTMLAPGVGGTGIAAKVANASIHLGSAGVLFGLPAYDATYKAKIEQGYTPDQAKVYAAKDFIMNTAAPSLVNMGVGKVFGTAAAEVAPTLLNTAKGLGLSGTEGLAFSVANTSIEKLLDNHFGKNPDSSYVDTSDLLPSALGFMAGSSIHAGSHLLDPTVAQHFEQVAKDKAATDAADAARANALSSWNTSGLSPSARVAPGGRVEPTWADVTGTPPAAPGDRREPTIADIGAATSVDEAIAAANAVVNSSKASPHATMAELDALEEAAGINQPPAPPAALGLSADHTAEEAQAAHDELMGAMSARAAEAAAQRPTEPDNLTNSASPDDAGDWHNFPPESRTLGVPRAQMPQIQAEHRGAMVNFLNARDISHEEVQVDPGTLKPTQREFSISKVQKALEHEGGDRAILISSDNYVLDGHHQWLAAIEKGEPIRAIRLNAPIKQLVKTVHEFPSATVDTSSATAGGLGQGARIGGTSLEAARAKHARQDEAVRQAIEAQARLRAGQAPQAPGSSVPTAAERAPVQPAPPPKPTAGQRMRERIRRDNPFLGFLATHGLHIDERSDTGGQGGRAGNVIVPGFGGSLYRKTGARLDELAQLAHEAGFLSDEDMANPADNGGTRKLADLIERAVHSKEVIQQPGLLEAAAPTVDQQLHEEAQRLGIETQGKTNDELYDEVAHAHRADEARRETSGAAHVDEQEHVDHYAAQVDPAELRDADIPFDLNDPRLAPSHELTEEEINALFGIQEAESPRADRGETQGHAAEHPHEGAAPAGEPGQEGQDLLTSYTASDVLAREDAATAKAKAAQAERDKLEAERKRQQDAKEARARADATVDDFQLGQDAHDQLSGQRGMFDEPAPAANVEAPSAAETAFKDLLVNKAMADYHELDASGKASFKAGFIEGFEGKPFPSAAVKDSAMDEGYRFGARHSRDLEQRHKMYDGAIDDLSDADVHAVHKNMGLAGEKQTADWKREAIKAEHPDDIEKGLTALEQNGTPAAALAATPAKVNQYNPERARPLLLIPCAEEKNEGTHKAIDLYKGSLFNVYRKWKPTENRPDVYILSAKHGIVHADTLLEHYEQPMTKERQAALLATPVDLSLFKGKNFNEVYIAGSANYRQLGLQYADELRKAGFVGPDAPVDHPPQGAGIGDQRGHFADYLRKVDLRGPENAGELSDQLDAEQRARQESETKAPETATEPAESATTDQKNAQVDHGSDIPAEFYQGVTVPYRALGAAEPTDMAAHEALANTRSEIQQLEDMLKCMGG